MQINTQQIESTVPTLLPRASGGGVSVPADGGGLHSSPPHPKSLIPNPPPLSAALTRDLLDPTVSALDLCNYHDLNLIELQAIINSNDFKKLKAAIEEINTARQTVIEPEARTAALATLTQILRQPIESQQHAETSRKAATKLEQITRPNTSHRPPRPKRPSNCSNPVKNASTPCMPPPLLVPSPSVNQDTQKREHTMHRTLIISSVLATTAAASGAAEIYLQDFSTQGLGYTTSIAEYNDGNADFFTQSAANTWNSNIVYNGADGDYFAGMDIDSEGASLPVSLTTETFDITGATDLQFAIDLAEDDANDGNNDWDLPDFVSFSYQVDGGAWINIFSAINDGSSFNSAAFVNGTEITDTFATFTADLTGVTGSSLAIRIDWDLNSGDEDLAIDNIRITGQTAAVVPLPPAVYASLALLGLMAARRRFR
jgi:hypothetical protein